MERFHKRSKNSSSTSHNSSTKLTSPDSHHVTKRNIPLVFSMDSALSQKKWD
ncbi:hypothetical protein LguiB_020356 [Lonicera macranthoides]